METKWRAQDTEFTLFIDLENKESFTLARELEFIDDVC